MNTGYMKTNSRFFTVLRERGLTLTELAKQAGVSRPHLSEVVANKPGRGGQVRRRVAPLLTAEERQLLGWDEEGKKVRSPKSEVRSPNS